MAATILLIDDDRQIREMAKYLLESEGYRVVGLSSAEEALGWLAGQVPDLILLDLVLPGMNGYEFCERLKASGAWRLIPIIMLTEKDAVSDVARGLHSYADDYIPKPFHPSLLVARIEAVLRRAGAPPRQPGPTSEICCQNLRINLETRQVFVDGKLVELQKMEFDILWLLSSHPLRVYEREQIIAATRGQEYYISERVIDNHIYRLRKKLGSACERIETVSGVGYRFKP